MVDTSKGILGPTTSKEPQTGNREAGLADNADKNDDNLGILSDNDADGEDNSSNQGDNYNLERNIIKGLQKRKTPKVTFKNKDDRREHKERRETKLGNTRRKTIIKGKHRLDRKDTKNKVKGKKLIKQNKLKKLAKELDRIKQTLNRKIQASTSDSSEESEFSSESNNDSSNSDSDSSESEWDSEGEEGSNKKSKGRTLENQQPAMNHLSELAGGRPGSYIPSSLPLSTFVKDKVKKKVWSHKYIDFSKLLDIEERPKGNSFALEVVNDRISKSKKSVHLPSFRMWDKCFMVFLGIHASNPDKRVDMGSLVNNLLCYRQTILDLSYQHYEWARYDRKFRQFIENTKQPIYNYRMQDLAESCKHAKNWTGNSVTNKNFQQRGERNNIPGVCHRFQNGTCTASYCRCQHICRKCFRSNHGSSICKANRTNNYSGGRQENKQNNTGGRTISGTRNETKNTS